MKVIIAGSREVTDYSLIESAIAESGFETTQIISGGARGVDKLGEQYAKEKNVPCRVMTANWDQYGKAAGYIRNEQMAEVADALIAIWDGKSKGTFNMINIAKKKNLKVFIKRTDESLPLGIG
jgi:hypothetical protein